MAREETVLVIETGGGEYAGSFQLITITRKGACRFCRQLVRFGGLRERREQDYKYYHEGYARRAMLLY